MFFGCFVGVTCFLECWQIIYFWCLCENLLTFLEREGFGVEKSCLFCFLG